MRSYTNKDGEKIIVSEEHLNTAVEIKKALQNSSPSRKAPSKQLVSMMETEGFFDAESSEPYRQMIKNYQKSIGKLPSVAKHADMVADSKLKSIKDLVGEISYEKRENQQFLTQINKGKRELIDFALIADEIGEAFKNHNFNISPMSLVRKEESEKKMVIQLSDFHIGSRVDNEFNKFNYEIAKERVAKYLSKVLEECKNNDITSVYVIQTGDEIEHFQMHSTQSFEAEMILSEQITKTTDLFISILSTLADNKLQIKFAGIAGNHSRLNFIKNMSQKNDTSTYIINNSIKSFIEHSKYESIEYIEAKPYEHSFVVNGVNIKALHGDRDNLRDGNILAKHSTLDGIQYDMIIGGHIHTRTILEVGRSRFVVTAGSLKGTDNFTSDTLRKDTSPSQNFYIIDENKEIEVRWVNL